MINNNSIRECFSNHSSSNQQFVKQLIKLAPRRQQVHDLSDEQTRTIVKNVITIYYQTQNQDRNYLDWITSFMNQYKTKEDMNKQLGNNLIIALYNSLAHHFLYHQDEQSMERSLQNITAYVDSIQDTPVDIILLSIGINNKSVLQMTNGNFETAYKLSYLIVQKLQQYIEEKRMKKSKLLQQDVVVLVNTYLIICQSLYTHLNYKSKQEWSKLQYNYEINLAHTYSKGLKMSQMYLGQESVITKAFKIMDDIQPVFDIPIVKVIVPTEQSYSPSQVKMDGILKMLETRIQHIQQIFINDQKLEQQPMVPSISAILPHKSSQISLNPSYKNTNKDIEFIKQINSFDDIPLNPTISNQIPVSPVYSSVAPVQFPVINKKSPVSSPLVGTPLTPLTPFNPLARGFSEVVQKVQRMQKIQQFQPAVKTPTIIQKIVQLQIDSEHIIPQAIQKIQQDKLLQILLQRFTQQQISLIMRLYQSKNIQLFLMKNQKQIDSLLLSSQQLQNHTSKDYSSPYLLCPDNISIEQKMIFYMIPYCNTVDQKLLLLTYPRSIIPDQKIKFLEQQLNLIVCFVQLNQFRILLIDNNQKQKLRYQFYISQQQADDKITNYVQSMQTHHRVKTLFDKYNRYKIQNKSVDIPVNYPIFKKIQKFIQQIHQSIYLMEEFIIKEQLSDQIKSKQKQYLFIYNLDQYKQRSSINCISEQKDRYLIRLQNHLKFPNQIIKLRQSHQYLYEDIKEDLGILPTNSFSLSTYSQNKYIKIIISDKHRLRKIRKDFVEEDYRLYSAHPLDQRIRFLYIGCKRIISYDQNSPNYWITTVTLVCNMDHVPLGIQVNIYFPLETKSQNIFLPISRYIWIKQRKTSQGNQNKFKITQAEKRRLKKKIFLNEFPVVTNYNLSSAMNRGGFQEIINILDIKDGVIFNKLDKTIRVQNLLFDNFY